MEQSSTSNQDPAEMSRSSSETGRQLPGIGRSSLPSRQSRGNTPTYTATTPKPSHPTAGETTATVEELLMVLRSSVLDMQSRGLCRITPVRDGGRIVQAIVLDSRINSDLYIGGDK